MQQVTTAELEAGKGIVGDRYHEEGGTFSKKLHGLPDKELTLIESEFIDAFNGEFDKSFGYGDFRRNVITRGIRLNDLVGKEFNIGKLRLRGIRLCEPCSHLASLLVPEVVPGLLHKAGLRAQVLEGGTLSVGDELN